MMPLWMLPLLSTISVGEFSYKGVCTIVIKGKLYNGEWIVDVYVNAIPYFAWGCNQYATGMRDSFNEVVKYYLTLIFNQLSEYSVDGRKDVFRVLKCYLE